MNKEKASAWRSLSQEERDQYGQQARELNSRTITELPDDMKERKKKQLLGQLGNIVRS